MADRAARPEALGADIEWLLRTTNRMLRCRSVAPLLDLAYDAIREGLGFDRVGLFLVDQTHQCVIERIGTDSQGKKFYPQDRRYPLTGHSHIVRTLQNPLLGVNGPGYIHVTNVGETVPAADRVTLDGAPEEILRVSLRTADTVVGFIGVDNLISKRPITQTQILPLVAFANALAMAVEHVSLLEARTSRIDTLDAELAWLREIGGRVNGADTLDEVLDIVYDGIRNGLGYDRVGIVLFDWERELFIEHRGTDENGEKMCPVGRTMSLAPDGEAWDGPDMRALREGAEFFYTDDVYRDTPPEQRTFLDGEPKHNLVVYLRSADKVTGLISVDNFVSGRPIYPDHAPPLLAFANQVATALEKARMLERERTERTRLKVLYEAARALSSTLDGDEILRVLAAQLVPALEATSARFSRLDRRDGARRPFRIESGVEMDNTAVHERLIEQVLRRRQSYVGTIHGEDAAFLQEHGLFAELFVPLSIQDVAIGVLEVYWASPVAIGPETVELCVTIAEQAALAMDNARLYAEAAVRAQTDPLTGLLNHRVLLDRVDRAIEDGKPFAVLLVDVDDFKLFNDTHGHLVGDAVLMQIAATLQDVCRDCDEAGRYGGDEFALILRDVTTQEASAVADRLIGAVRDLPHLTAHGEEIPLSVSVGIASFPNDAETRQGLIAVADAGMYAAKEDGSYEVQREAADLLGDTPFGVLEGLVMTVDTRDRYTREHSDHVARLALLIADELGLDDGQRQVLAVAGALHDVGKIALPTRILCKPGRVTPAEYDIVKRHVDYGVALIRAVLDSEAVVDAVAFHHERWDGRGYPYGVSGAETPLIGRIMQVADAVSAMRLDRPYRRGMSWELIEGELRAGAGSQFDPVLVEVLLAAINRLEGSYLPQMSA